jgi:hypothetical protein
MSSCINHDRTADKAVERQLRRPLTASHHMKRRVHVGSRVHAQQQRRNVHTVALILPHRPAQLERLIAWPHRDGRAERLTHVIELQAPKGKRTVGWWAMGRGFPI